MEKILSPVQCPGFLRRGGGQPIVVLKVEKMGGRGLARHVNALCNRNFFSLNLVTYIVESIESLF